MKKYFFIITVGFLCSCISVKNNRTPAGETTVSHSNDTNVSQKSQIGYLVLQLKEIQSQIVEINSMKNRRDNFLRECNDESLNRTLRARSCAQEKAMSEKMPKNLKQQISGLAAERGSIQNWIVDLLDQNTTSKRLIKVRDRNLLNLLRKSPECIDFYKLESGQTLDTISIRQGIAKCHEY